MPDIVHSLQSSTSAEAIFPLISTPQGLTRWWAEDMTELDGAVELGFFNRQTVYRLRLERRDAPYRAEWRCETGDEWNGTRLIFALEPNGAGALIRFTHAGWRSQTDYFVSCNTVWGELMFRLKGEAEGRSPGPLFRRDSLAYGG